MSLQPLNREGYQAYVCDGRDEWVLTGNTPSTPPEPNYTVNVKRGAIVWVYVFLDSYGKYSPISMTFFVPGEGTEDVPESHEILDFTRGDGATFNQFLAELQPLSKYNKLKNGMAHGEGSYYPLRKQAILHTANYSTQVTLPIGSKAVIDVNKGYSGIGTQGLWKVECEGYYNLYNNFIATPGQYLDITYANGNGPSDYTLNTLYKEENKMNNYQIKDLYLSGVPDYQAQTEIIFNDLVGGGAYEVEVTNVSGDLTIDYVKKDGVTLAWTDSNIIFVGNWVTDANGNKKSTTSRDKMIVCVHNDIDADRVEIGALKHNGTKFVKIEVKEFNLHVRGSLVTGCIELVSATPYIDFSNNESQDYCQRLIMWNPSSLMLNDKVL